MGHGPGRYCLYLYAVKSYKYNESARQSTKRANKDFCQEYTSTVHQSLHFLQREHQTILWLLKLPKALRSFLCLTQTHAHHCQRVPQAHRHRASLRPKCGLCLAEMGHLLRPVARQGVALWVRLPRPQSSPCSFELNHKITDFNWERYKRRRTITPPL